MIFNSREFILLFMCCLILNYVLAPRYRKWLLLAGSAVFIGFNHLGFLAIATTTALLTYGTGLWIDSKKDEDKRLSAFRISLIAHVLILVFFKYFGFLELNMRSMVNYMGGSWESTIRHIFLPLGISFYIFQSISYLIEVHWEEIEAERNLGSFMLYMLFFMKFLSGPIERPGDFLPQIKASGKFDYDKVTYGLKLIVLGLFKKIVIADRLAPALNDVFNNVHDCSGAQLLMATLIYPIQLYTDFSGYTDIAIGGAAIFGYQLSSNFNRPFTAKSISDLWRRWHMTLSFWVRDYIYEPMAMSKRSWGVWGISYALLVTFVLLGIWHGDSWNFVIYGAIQGVIIIYEMVFAKWRDKWIKRIPIRLSSIYSILRTYILFSISLLFFRIEKFSDVLYTLRHMLDGISLSYKELNLGISDHDLIIFALATILMFFFEYANVKWELWKKLDTKPMILRWSVYYIIIFILCSQGKFGSEDFIYFQF